MISMILKTVQQTTSNFHQAFPTVIYEKKLPGFLSLLYNSFEDGKFDNTTGRITGELNGKVLVHQDQRLEPFFKALKKCVVEYLDHFAVDKPRCTKQDQTKCVPFSRRRLRRREFYDTDGY